MNKKTIHDCLDARLSGIEVTETQKDALLKRICEEEKPVKRKISTSILIVALVIVLLTATALAAFSLYRSSESEAISRAREVLSEAYDLTPPTLGLFITTASRNGDAWEVTFRADNSDGIDAERMGNYVVTLRDGKEPTVDWTHSDVDTSLWLGGGLEAPVWGQEQMLEALVQKRNATVTREMANAGISNENTASEPIDMTAEQQAAMLAAANQAMMDKYDFTDTTLALFTAQTIVSETSDDRHIDIIYTPDYAKHMAMYEKMGRYYITLNADSGEVVKTYWSEEALWDDKPYTQSNWGSAPAYHAKLLPWMLELYEKIDRLASPYGLDGWDAMIVYDLSLADKGAYDQLFRDTGFTSAEGYYRTIPDENDVPYEEARKIARQVLIQDMSLTEEKLDAADFDAERYIDTDNTPTYCFFFYTNMEGYDEVYSVFMDARTGEILSVDVVTGGNG